MQAGTVDHPSRKNFRPADPEWTLIDFLQHYAERRAAETWERGKEGREETSGAGRTDDGERRPLPTLIFREDHRVEKKRDEI
jgi:hypothetical protein